MCVGACDGVSVCLSAAYIHTMGPYSLALFVHIYDFMLKDLSWLRWFTVFDKAVLLITLFSTTVDE